MANASVETGPAEAALRDVANAHQPPEWGRWLLWAFVLAVPGPYLANEAGWTTAEVGRQPWLVYGLLRTRDGLSAAVKADMVLASILMFSFVYLLLFAVWVYVMNDKIQHGPEAPHPVPAGAGEGFLRAATLDASRTDSEA